MGLFSWLFPTPEQQLDKARAMLERGAYAQARDLAETLEVEGAAAVVAGARAGLVRLNLDEALALARAEEFERAEEHLSLARGFDDGGSAEALRLAARELRGLRASARQRVKKGLELANDPSILSPGADPVFSLPPDDPRLRYAMGLEAWPEDLRERLVALGPDFAAAASRLDAGDPGGAIEAITPFIEREPAARYERARAAEAAGRLAMASSDLASFAEAVGHRQIGGVHTGALLGGLLLRQGRAGEALAALDRGLASDPESLPMRATRAVALEALGRYAEADEAAVALVKRAPRDLGLYRLMARCRLRAGKRVEAMQVLEAGLSRNCTSGRCGAQPFDVASGRMLAQLYLEDRLDPQRAAELLAQIKAAVGSPGPFERYLDALVLRNAGDPEAEATARQILASIEPGHPLRLAERITP